MTTAQEVLEQQPAFANYEPPLSERHAALLEVICHPDGGGQQRLQAWLDSVDLKNLDDSFYRLYPFVAERLAEWDPRHPLFGFFRGNSRKTFYTNNLLFHRAANQMAALQAQDIPVLILKGAALVESRAYRSGLRAMADIDFAIPTPELGRALDILTPLGLGPDDVATLRDFQHGHTFQDELGFEYDLHWHVLLHCRDRPEANQAFWEASEELQFHGVSVRCLCPTDSLLQVCVHGLQYNPFPPVRWIPDSLALIRQCGPQLDWSRLAWLAGQTGSTLLLLLALRYLHRRFAAAIPPAAFAALEATPISPLEAACLPLEFTPWDARVPWQQAEPVLQEQLKLQAQRHPHRQLLVLLPRDGWTPAQSERCRQLGGIPIVKANGLPAEWQPAVQRYIDQNAPQLLPALLAFHRQNPGAPATHVTQLNDPATGVWQIVIQSLPPGPNGTPQLRVIDVYQSPVTPIPVDALLLDAGRYALARPAPSRLGALRTQLAIHNQRIVAGVIPAWKSEAAAPEH